MDLTKKGFHLPEKIRFEEDTLTHTYGKLIAEPLERGFGMTLGNSLRRILLSSIEGAAPEALRVRGAVHEFSHIDGVKEDLVDIILNVKTLRFAMEGTNQKTAIVKAVGPKEITGADLQVDASLRVLNPEQLIANIDRGVEFDAEIFVGKGKGYIPADENPEELVSVDVIPLDAAYSPIRKVNFTVDRARVGRSSDFDKLILEVWTDGSVTPQGAVSQAASIMMGHLDFFVFEEEGSEEEALSVPSIKQDDATFNQNLLKNVEELELSVRAHNCLKNAEIKNIADLVQRTEYEMLRTKNFGRKSLNEIKEILNTMGLSFGMRIDPDVLKKMRGE